MAEIGSEENASSCTRHLYCRNCYQRFKPKKVWDTVQEHGSYSNSPRYSRQRHSFLCPLFFNFQTSSQTFSLSSCRISSSSSSQCKYLLPATFLLTSCGFSLCFLFLVVFLSNSLPFLLSPLSGAASAEKRLKNAWSNSHEARLSRGPGVNIRKSRANVLSL